MSRVLVVEDDEAMAVALRDGFTYEGHEVTVARDGEAGLTRAREDSPDIMILDVMLPKMTGLEVCKLLRGEGSNLPIIMLTARGQEIDKVLGLKLGADDYVTKPFSFMELMARVEAVLRRSQPGGGAQGAVYEFGSVTVDVDRHEATRGGNNLELTPRRAPRRGVGLRHHSLHPDRRHPHRQVAQEDRGRPRRSTAFDYSSPPRLQIRGLKAGPHPRQVISNQ
jgi:two-component system alkaline phosphatase synthesis response regulator PhoP